MKIKLRMTPNAWTIWGYWAQVSQGKNPQHSPNHDTLSLVRVCSQPGFTQFRPQSDSRMGEAASRKKHEITKETWHVRMRRSVTGGILADRLLLLVLVTVPPRSGDRAGRQVVVEVEAPGLQDSSARGG